MTSCSVFQAIRNASAALGGLDGITTFCEMAVPLVARLTEALGLPGNTPEAVDAARDKVGRQQHQQPAAVQQGPQQLLHACINPTGPKPAAAAQGGNRRRCLQRARV